MMNEDMIDGVDSQPQPTGTIPEQSSEAQQDTTHGVEKFSAADLLTLRSEMLQNNVDSFQAADIVTSFLSGRGYGVSNDEARSVAAAIERTGCPVERIQSELERVARSA